MEETPAQARLSKACTNLKRNRNPAATHQLTTEFWDATVTWYEEARQLEDRVLSDIPAKTTTP